MKFTMNFEINLDDAPKNWQVQELQKMILESSQAACGRMFQEALLVFEKDLLKRNRKNWDRKERWLKTIHTRFGSLEIERYRVWDRNEGKSRYPLDESLGVKKWRKESVEFEDVVVNQVVKRSYRQSHAEIVEQTGADLSVMSAWSIVQEAGKKERLRAQPALPWKNLLLPEPPKFFEEDPCPAIGIDLDGTYCRSWKKKRYQKDHAVRVAVLYRHKVKVGKGRWLLHDKIVLTSGPGERLKDFLNRVTHTAVIYYGLHQKTLIVVHGDGDPWIRNYALHHFAHAIYRLDTWHVKKKIREACDLDNLPENWEAAIYGKPDELIWQIKMFRDQFQKESLDRIRVTELVQYLENNKEGLKPSGVSHEIKAKHPRLFLRGSGTIERNIGWTVNDRFKLPRMSWSQMGLENLLHLRENYLNKRQTPKYPPIPARPLELEFLS